MKKLALTAIATAAIALGHAPVSAQESEGIPVECAEQEVITEECERFYVGAEPQPPGEKEEDEVEALTPAGRLPQTGGGVSPLLGVGGLLFVGGGIFVVASRRRTSAAPSAV